MLTYDELSAAERALWDAFPEGQWVDLRTGIPEDDDPAGGTQWGPERTVRAEVVAALLLGGNTEQSSRVASLRLAGAHITGRLDLAGADISHLLWLRECRLAQEVGLHAASTRTIRITGSRVPGVEAELARIDGHLDLDGSVMETGRLSLMNAHVAGELDMDGTRILAPGEWAVWAGGLTMGGGIYCRDGFTARGGVRLPGAQLSGGLFMPGARLENPDGVALVADNVTAPVVDMSQGFSAAGTLRIRGARISDLLTLERATLGGSDTALLGVGMQVGTFDFTVATPPAGAVDLQGARVTVLHDHEQSWPKEVRMDGLFYGSLRSDRTSPQDDVAHRVAWIRRNPGYAPQPYEQLASCYRQTGHDDAARRVLLEKQRHRRRTLNPPGRVWGYLLDAAVGYGYRPWLAALWMTTLCLLGTLVFSARSPIRTKPGEGNPFNPFIYTIDLLFPIGDFGQRSAWHWEGATQWLSYLLIAVGWLLTTAVVAGVSRTLNRN
ncbi:oxidoreductase [Streptomyces botrytidirepellens]|uniref:Oxidoreductase n=1 Tax=Streptomyces botrytidirepellens TaxID=2486417 RepID=A0A3M8SVW8_9ACTN|nr:oxidoreductase [Streptomyces botrytidirepellens]RNF83000.1 oxidoreductase [Streptomyces botrytidirepellens]